MVPPRLASRLFALILAYVLYGATTPRDRDTRIAEKKKMEEQLRYNEYKLLRTYGGAAFQHLQIEAGT